MIKLDILAIGAHPDDIELGCSATIAKEISRGKKVGVLDLTRGELGTRGSAEIRDKEAAAAAVILGLTIRENLGFKDGFFINDEVHQKAVIEIIRKYQPEVVLCNAIQDRHIDHRTIFDASVVSCRPSNKNFPKVVLAYETLSETHWNVPGIETAFIPDLFIDTSNYMKQKEKALNSYKSQIAGNQSRSVDACMGLAKFRGSQNGCDYAEAFKVVRIVI